jgi:hypothetical protein
LGVTIEKQNPTKSGH